MVIMATSINIDLSNIGDKVAAAIQESMEKMVSEKVAAVKKDMQEVFIMKDDQNKNDASAIAGLHKQILANAKFLAPIFARTTYIPNSDLAVVTLGVGTSISGRVLYKSVRNETCPLLVGPDEASQVEALEKLLKLSSMLVNERWDDNVSEDLNRMDAQEVDEGTYYAEDL
ncbi:hypothetical protein HII31_07448 [Pseudocercospora fuligena]|uniref:Uncharacterized protein n=1 Tax=Pseudocercospora fuligena TaxID=685502 RepID=A0A8H6VH81_9PEZI|nr:hypothetical protein HII31_07448 [Pseudocercospora fuligena]